MNLPYTLYSMGENVECIIEVSDRERWSLVGFIEVDGVKSDVVGKS